MNEQNRNVRITYPDSRNEILEIDFVQGVEVELHLPIDLLRYYAKDGKVEINQNLFALPGYRNYLRSKVMEITLSDDESPDDDKSASPVFRWIPSDDADFSK